MLTSRKEFDAVVVASGHYHACNIPNIPGLSELKRAFPNAVRHSKLYRSGHDFRDQTILLIGGGVSSLDIAKDLGNVARRVLQSTRHGPYDLPAHLLPENAVRIGAIQSFDLQGAVSEPRTLREGGSVTLTDGRTICGIDQVIICTGYYVSFPYMRQYHNDGIRSADADDTVLVTDGQQTHNLHKDIFYIPDPTLAFIGELPEGHNRWRLPAPATLSISKCISPESRIRHKLTGHILRVRGTIPCCDLLGFRVPSVSSSPCSVE